MSYFGVDAAKRQKSRDVFENHSSFSVCSNSEWANIIFIHQYMVDMQKIIIQ